MEGSTEAHDATPPPDDFGAPEISDSSKLSSYTEDTFGLIRAVRCTA